LILVLFGVRYVSSRYSSNLITFETTKAKYHVQLEWLADHTKWYQQGNGDGWAGFDKVYFISMPDRLVNVKQVAERLGVSNSASILQAINKDTLNITELLQRNIVVPEYLYKLRDRGHGVIGCQLSHLAVLLDCIKDPNAKTCVIFEDDLYKPAKEVTTQIVNFRHT
jgi:hypothetical protein